MTPRRVRGLFAAGCLVVAATAAQVLAAAPPTRHALPAGALLLSDSSVPAGSSERITFSVRLDREVAGGRLALTLPRLWTQRSGVSGMRFARLPRKGEGSSGRTTVTRSGRVVSFAFSDARDGDSGRYDVHDNGIRAGTYRLPYRWHEHGRVSARGTARVVFATRTRPRR